MIRIDKSDTIPSSGIYAEEAAENSDPWVMTDR